MRILKFIKNFVSNGVKIFRQASSGHYHSESEAVSNFKKELDNNDSGFKTDAMNLRKDRFNVGSDLHKSFNQLVTAHE